jgi:hypothetical protein
MFIKLWGKFEILKKPWIPNSGTVLTRGPEIEVDTALRPTARRIGLNIRVAHAYYDHDQEGKQMTGATAGATAAAAAAAAAAKLREEEEELTPYHSDDLDGWEFKIVRSHSSKFKTAQAVQKLCEQESHAGWEMVEKFDDSRIRFKRRADMRSRDQYLGPNSVDPYRTLVGPSEAHIVLYVLAGFAAVGLIIFLISQLVR